MSNLAFRIDSTDGATQRTYAGASPAIKKWGGHVLGAEVLDAAGVEANGPGFPLPNRLIWRLEERRELPQRGPGQSPGPKRISVLFKCHRMPVLN